MNDGSEERNDTVIVDALVARTKFSVNRPKQT